MDFPLETDPATAARLVAEGALLLDVREPFELAICSIPGSQALPMRQIPESLGQLPRDRPVFVLCHSGGRSRRVAEYLRAHGFSLVSNVTGGIDAWAEQVDPNLPRY